MIDEFAKEYLHHDLRWIGQTRAEIIDFYQRACDHSDATICRSVKRKP
jgi:hypothetical protein